jgi:hypothetical protein
MKDLPLPNLLVEMLNSGRWKAPDDKELIKKIGIEDADDLSFLSLAGMESNTNQLRQLALNGYSDLMGLCSGNVELLPEGYLDVTKAIVIAATYGDEALCLDYSNSIEPKIVVTNNTGSSTRWLLVAENFEKFVEILGL